MDFMLGCNYWDSKSGTEMWVNWDPEVVDDDLRVLSRYGVSYLRFFPIWRDFQPVHKLYGWQQEFKEYRLHGKDLPENEFFLDEAMMARFAELLKLCEKYNMKATVGIVTGWMSGVQYVPPAIYGKNPINDPEALMLQIKFVKGFVRRFKDSPVIKYWEVGNESNSMGPAEDRCDPYVWTATIVNAIKSEDNTRPIASGMHALAPHYTMNGTRLWTLQDQGELCDIICPHPYPSRTIGGEKDLLNRPRTTYLPSAQLEYYSSISGRPAMIEESGTFNRMLSRGENAADFIRINILSGWANGSLGYLWWCGMEHSHITYPPYSWSNVERELGLLYGDKSPKPVALEMKRISEIFATLPFEELPKKEYDCVCVTTFMTDWWGINATAYQLAKEAGFDISYAWCQQKLPDAPLYIVPSITGWASMPFETLDAIMKNVQGGANALFTCKDGFIAEFEDVVGLSSSGMQNNSEVKKVKFGESELDIVYSSEFMLSSIDAEVLAEDENGNVVFSRKKHGKGYVYFLDCPLEEMLWNNAKYLRDAKTYPYYKIYEAFAKDVIDNKVVVSRQPDIGVTRHKVSENEYIIVAINYQNETLPTEFVIKPHKSIEVLYGDMNSIPKCEMTVLKITL